MACVDLTYISNEECIGNSLSSINGNFAALSSAVCDLSANSPFNVFDSPTIDLDWNSSTRTLSADVKADSIRYSHLASWQTLSGSPTLSAEAVQPRLAKAWVNFDGKGFGATYPATSASVIRSGYNVSSVTEVALGKYEINFTAPLATNTYAFALGLSATAAGNDGANGNGETILQDGVFSTTKFGLQVMYNSGAFPRESSIVTGIFFSI